jgi:hypothetical protein
MESVNFFYTFKAPTLLDHSESSRLRSFFARLEQKMYMTVVREFSNIVLKKSGKS